MGKHICIAMSQQTFFIRNIHAAYYTFSFFHKSVYIKTFSDSCDRW